MVLTYTPLIESSYTIGKVHSAHTVLNLSELEALSMKRLQIVDKLEKAHAFFVKNKKHLFIRNGFHLEKVQATQYYQEQLSDTNEKMSLLQNEMILIAGTRNSDEVEEYALQTWINRSLGPDSFRTAETIPDETTETEYIEIKHKSINVDEIDNQSPSTCDRQSFANFFFFFMNKLGFGFLRQKYSYLRGNVGTCS